MIYYETTLMCHLIVSFSLVIIPYVQSEGLYHIYVVGLPSEVAKKITFEE